MFSKQPLTRDVMVSTKVLYYLVNLIQKTFCTYENFVILTDELHFI